MTVVLKYLGQIAVYAVISVVIGYFANAPSYTRIQPDQSLIKLSFAHGAKKKGECRRLTREELEKLPPNMRNPVVCGRERLPVSVELEADGKLIYADTLHPTGLTGDGPSRAYQRFVMEPGSHLFVARLRDSDRQEGFDYVNEKEVQLSPGQSLAIDFNPIHGGFSFE